MKFVLTELLFPHYCCSCAQIGGILCQSCLNDIITENSTQGMCLGCQTLTSNDGICQHCRHSFTKAWAAGHREDVLRQLIDESKYHSRRDGCKIQALLLDTIVPQLPSDIIIVPVPTVRRHVRVRGYGHSELIAKSFAARRNLPYQLLLRRRGSHVQQGATQKDRIDHAKVSYLGLPAARDHTILLIDDVYTTGSTVRYAAQALKDAGAREIWVAVSARQTLDG